MPCVISWWGQSRDFSCVLSTIHWPFLWKMEGPSGTTPPFLCTLLLALTFHLLFLLPRIFSPKMSAHSSAPSGLWSRCRFPYHVLKDHCSLIQDFASPLPNVGQASGISGHWWCYFCVNQIQVRAEVIYTVLAHEVRLLVCLISPCLTPIYS